MNTDDRAEFDSQLGQLCAGYNIPLTDERKEAYWTGLQKLHIAAFKRVVEYALGEHAPEKFPTVRAVWDLHKMLRRQRAEPPAEAMSHADVTNLAAFANRRLLAFLMTTGAASDVSLKRMVLAKQEITERMRAAMLEREITADEFAKNLRNEWALLWLRKPWLEIETDRRRLCEERKWADPVSRPVPREFS